MSLDISRENGTCLKSAICGRWGTPDPPSFMTYASVVIRNSVRIASLVVALNDLDILARDIRNAYMNAKTKEKRFLLCQV